MRREKIRREGRGGMRNREEGEGEEGEEDEGEA